MRSISLLGLNHLSELDKIAFRLETSNMAKLSVLKIILANRGVDLHDYNMNHRQQGLSFHSSGLEDVFKFLGIDAKGY